MRVMIFLGFLVLSFLVPASLYFLGTGADLEAAALHGHGGHGG